MRDVIFFLLRGQKKNHNKYFRLKELLLHGSIMELPLPDLPASSRSPGERARERFRVFATRHRQRERTSWACNENARVRVRATCRRRWLAVPSLARSVIEFRRVFPRKGRKSAHNFSTRHYASLTSPRIDIRTLVNRERSLPCWQMLS